MNRIKIAIFLFVVATVLAGQTSAGKRKKMKNKNKKILGCRFVCKGECESFQDCKKDCKTKLSLDEKRSCKMNCRKEAPDCVCSKICSNETTSANQTSSISRKNKIKKWPGVGCGIKCMDECNLFKDCKKACKTTSTDIEDKKTCRKECRQNKGKECFTCKDTCLKQGNECQQQNCTNCPSDVGPRQIKISHPECYQCMVANCLSYGEE